MTGRAASWTATANFRLGHHWQGSGDYERAEAAYQAVLDELHDHAPTLFNLSVTRIRQTKYRAALVNLDHLARVRPNEVPQRIADDGLPAEKWSAVGCSAAYNRALAHHYLKEDKDAVQWSQRLASRVLEDRPVSRRAKASRTAERSALDKLEMSALILHASLSVLYHSGRQKTPPEELVDGALLGDPLVERALDEELGVDADDHEQRESERRRLLQERLGESLVAMYLEWYVRRKAHEDIRTRYNLACYVARLSALGVPDHARDRLQQRGLEHADIALRDGRLAAWAMRDPALRPLGRHPEWSRLLERASKDEQAVSAPPSPDGAPDTQTAPEQTEPAAAPVPTDDRHTLIDQAVELLEQVRVSRAPDNHSLERLRARMESLSDAAFHRAVVKRFAELSDPATAYIAPAHPRRRLATLPAVLERCVDGGRTRYLVSMVDDAHARSLPRGAEVTHWNGVPIAAAIEGRTHLIGAPTAAARAARALAALTHLPVDLLGPPDSEVVTVRHRHEDADHEALLRWRFGEDSQRRATERYARRSTDVLAAAVRGAREALEPAKGYGESPYVRGSEIPGHKDYGLLCVRSFDVDDVDEFVDEVVTIVAELPLRGIAIDLRGNAGGWISAAERLLQLFTPRTVEPQRLRARASDLMVSVARGGGEARWQAPLDAAIEAGDRVTEPFELEAGHRDACNDVGQLYHGPVRLIVDALTGGAAEFFVAGFLAHGIGSITSVDDPSGNEPRPAEIWSHRLLLGSLSGHALQALPAHASFCVPVRRADLGDPWGGRKPQVHHRTRADILDEDRDLLAGVVEALAAKPERTLRPKLELVKNKTIEGEVTLRGLARLRVVVDGTEAQRVEVEDGVHKLALPVKGDEPHKVELLGEAPDGTLLAERRLMLGGG